MDVATRRRLHDELGVDAPLRFVYKFRYQAGFGGDGAEHELCHVFLGRLEAAPAPNDSEIAAIRYLSARELDAALGGTDDRFTPWFRMEWRALRNDYPAILGRYIA